MFLFLVLLLCWKTLFHFLISRVLNDVRAKFHFYTSMLRFYVVMKLDSIFIYEVKLNFKTKCFKFVAFLFYDYDEC